MYFISGGQRRDSSEENIAAPYRNDQKVKSELKFCRMLVLEGREMSLVPGHGPSVNEAMTG